MANNGKQPHVGDIKGTLKWRVHLPNLLGEILSNPGTGILQKPLTITASIIDEVSERASELNDPILNECMARLTLYAVADPASPDFNKGVIDEIHRLAHQYRTTGDAGKGVPERLGTHMWQDASVSKPEDFKPVLLQLSGGEYTTGWYSSQAGAWIGLAYNQSPPVYRMEAGAVAQWQEIEPDQ